MERQGRPAMISVDFRLGVQMGEHQVSLVERGEVSVGVQVRLQVRDWPAVPVVDGDGAGSAVATARPGTLTVRLRTISCPLAGPVLGTKDAYSRQVPGRSAARAAVHVPLLASVGWTCW